MMNAIKRLMFLAPLLAAGLSFAAEFEVLDKLSVDGYTVLRGSADIPGGSFSVGASTFAVKDGKAGVGTASPAAQLHLFRREDTGAAAGMPEIRLEHQDIRAVGVGGSNGGRFNFYNIQRDNTAWAADSVWGEIGFYPSQPTAGAAQIGAKILAAADGSIGGTQTSSYLSFQTTSGSALAERLRVNSAGNVGINTTAPGARLEVNGTALFGSDMFTYQNGGIFFSGNGLYGSGIYGRNSGNDLVFNSGGAEKMRILTSGNVGIGTTGPDGKLDVRGDLNFGANHIGRIKDDGTNTLVDAVTSGSGIIFRNNGAVESMRITSGGSVGIGTTAPAEKLDVAGNYAVNGNRIVGGYYSGTTTAQYTSGTWFNLFSSADVGTGAFLVQVGPLSTYSVGGAMYSQTAVFLASLYGNTNGNDTVEIHSTNGGHATNGRIISFRYLATLSSVDGKSYVQMAVTETLSAPVAIAWKALKLF